MLHVKIALERFRSSIFGSSPKNKVDFYNDIILIGPSGVGKTTIAGLLSDKLNLPVISLDEVKYEYYKKVGYKKKKQDRIKKIKGFRGVYEYWKPYEAYLVEKVLATNSNCVFDFGGGHSVYESQKLFNRIKDILYQYKNVVLLIPSPSVEESLKILSSRKNHHELNQHFLAHPSNKSLAKLIIYTKDKTSEEICAEILSKISITPIFERTIEKKLSLFER